MCGYGTVISHHALASGLMFAGLFFASPVPCFCFLHQQWDSSFPTMLKYFSICTVQQCTQNLQNWHAFCGGKGPASNVRCFVVLFVWFCFFKNKDSYYLELLKIIIPENRFTQSFSFLFFSFLKICPYFVFSKRLLNQSTVSKTTRTSSFLLL